ncbi:MAG: esterase, partial [Chloroflexi bacterium]
MNRDYRKWWSPALSRDMELLVFGSGGTPVLVFPTSMGRFYQWEDFGMVAHMADRIDEGWLQLWCVDSVDSESFYDKKRPAQERAARHVAYEGYLVDEVLPAIRSSNGVDYLVTIGASFGAFHALAFATRRPGIARKAIG